MAALAPAPTAAAAPRAAGPTSRRAMLAPAPTASQPRSSVACRALAPIVVSTVAAGAAAWLLAGQEAAQEQQDQLETPSELRRPCPSCDGTGFESCHCARWSDGDVGCSSCGHTGMMACRACRGGGRAVPIKVQVRKTDV